MIVHRLSLVPALTILGLALLHGVATAADFNFVVPVQLNHLPSDVDGAAIVCEVFGTVSGVAVEVGQGGSTSLAMPIVGGAFHGDVSISFNADDGRDPRVAATYQCTLSLWHNGPPTLRYFGEGSTWYNPRFADQRTFPRVAGAPFADSTGTQPLPH